MWQVAARQARAGSTPATRGLARRFAIFTALRAATAGGRAGAAPGAFRRLRAAFEEFEAQAARDGDGFLQLDADGIPCCSAAEMWIVTRSSCMGTPEGFSP